MSTGCAGLGPDLPKYIGYVVWHDCKDTGGDPLTVNRQGCHTFLGSRILHTQYAERKPSPMQAAHLCGVVARDTFSFSPSS